VIPVFDGFAALKMVRILLPHLVLLDDGLPGMDGLECLDLLRASKGMHQTPVILMSAAPPQSVHARTDLILLEKPFEMASLLTLIRHLLAFELTRFFLFPPLIYKLWMEEAR
jgi:DNA-binding response OmpR family regulator